MVSERKKHEFVENKKSTGDQYQGGTQPASPQNGWPEKEIKSNRKYQNIYTLKETIINSACTELLWPNLKSYFTKESFKNKFINFCPESISCKDLLPKQL